VLDAVLVYQADPDNLAPYVLWGILFTVAGALWVIHASEQFLDNSITESPRSQL